MKRFSYVLFVNLFLCIALLFATNALASLTGEELNDSFNAISTNALNYNSSTLPYVLFVSNNVGEVTLHFYNNFRL